MAWQAMQRVLLDELQRVRTAARRALDAGELEEEERTSYFLHLTSSYYFLLLTPYILLLTSYVLRLTSYILHLTGELEEEEAPAMAASKAASIAGGTGRVALDAEPTLPRAEV